MLGSMYGITWIDLAVIKGFLELSAEKDNYHIVQAHKELKNLTKNLIDLINQIQKNL